MSRTSSGKRTKAASHTLRACASSRRRPLDLRHETIRFNFPGGRQIDVTPDIRHGMRARWMGFGDVGHADSVVTHTFDVVVEPFDLKGSFPELDDENPYARLLARTHGAVRAAVRAPARTRGAH